MLNLAQPHRAQLSVLQGPRTIEKTLEALKTADQLAKSESMGTSAGAMAAFKGKPKSTMDSKDKKFFCKFHGKNILHNSEKCKKLIADAGKVADGEHAHMAAGVSQIGLHLI